MFRIETLASSDSSFNLLRVNNGQEVGYLAPFFLDNEIEGKLTSLCAFASKKEPDRAASETCSLEFSDEIYIGIISSSGRSWENRYRLFCYSCVDGLICYVPEITLSGGIKKQPLRDFLSERFHIQSNETCHVSLDLRPVAMMSELEKLAPPSDLAYWPEEL